MMNNEFRWYLALSLLVLNSSAAGIGFATHDIVMSAIGVVGTAAATHALLNVRRRITEEELDERPLYVQHKPKEIIISRRAYSGSDPLYLQGFGTLTITCQKCAQNTTSNT